MASTLRDLSKAYYRGTIDKLEYRKQRRDFLASLGQQPAENVQVSSFEQISKSLNKDNASTA